METETKHRRYERCIKQVEELFAKTADPFARMATLAAILFHKFDHYSWCGMYRLVDGALTVGPYQGLVACLVLKKDTGVCWAGLNSGRTLIVPDVSAFPGHIACDARSRSEIVVPLRNREGRVVGVIDVDSDRLDSFDAVDANALERLAGQIVLP